MLEIRASRGNTELRLVGSELKATIGGHDAGSYSLPASRASDIWKRLKAISIPLVPDLGMIGVGGTLSDIEMSHGMSHLKLGWWMQAPSSWSELDSVFDVLARHLPDAVTSRYDFARGGE